MTSPCFVAGLTCETTDPAVERWLRSLDDSAAAPAAARTRNPTARWERDAGRLGRPASATTPCWSLGSVSGFLHDGRPVFQIPDGGAVWLADPGRARVFGEPLPDNPAWQDLLLAAVFELAAAAGGVAFHAAVVEWRERGVLVAAPSGAGKSTLTYSAVIGGARYSGDDVAVIRWSAGRWHAHGFGVGLRVFPDMRTTADPFVASGARDEDGKVALRPASAYASRAHDVAIHRLAFLRPEHGSESQWRRCVPAEVLPRLLEHAALALAPATAARQLEQIGQLARVPAGELETGRDLLASPASRTRALLEQMCRD